MSVCLRVCVFIRVCVCVCTRARPSACVCVKCPCFADLQATCGRSDGDSSAATAMCTDTWFQAACVRIRVLFGK